MSLEIKKEAEELLKMYKDSPRYKTFNAIVYGKVGTGKTTLLKTCRRPVHVDSFDPGGTKVIEDEPEIYIDNRWENEDPFAPHVAKEWDAEWHRRKKMNYFEKLGTYAIDSCTTWADCIMYQVMKKAGRIGEHPFKQDWLPQMQVIQNAMREFVALPCDCILIGHDQYEKDEGTGRMFIGLLITGKLVQRIPLLFDEIYCAQTKETQKGIEYQLLTKPTGLYQARSRLSKGGVIETYEEPDIKKILKKAGLPTEDKPSLLEE